jgi:predicted metal-dependent HD superfamily phosphohydrolase
VTGVGIDMAERMWIAACERHGAASGLARDQWRAILTAYAEPWRHYHTIDHIWALLALRRQHSNLFANPTIVDLAIVLHDIVYDPKRSDNEQQSADRARKDLGNLGVSADCIDEVTRYIVLSKHDPAALASVDRASDAALFLDLDLSVLAADEFGYARYARAIRQEYAVYPDPLYRPGRAKVLRSFLARPAIYCSAALAAAWEDPARRNLEAELRDLDTGT